MKIEVHTAPPKRAHYIWLVIAISLFTLTASTLATRHLLHQVSVVATPDLTNKSIESARSIVRVKRLEIKISEYRFDQRIAANHVLQQNPLPGEMIESDKTVTVIVSRGLKSQEVPVLSGLSLDEAIRTLSDIGFNVGRTTRFYTSEADKEIVLDQQPAAGSAASRSANIHLLVSQGQRPVWLIMPVLKGWQVDDAANVIKFIGMQLQEIKRITTTDHPPGIILDQTPHAGIRTKAGDPAGLVVSYQAAETTFETRLLTLDYLVPALQKEVRIKFFIRDDTGLHEVYNAMEKSSSKISIRRTVSGEQVKLFIYLNGKLQEERDI
ncbi:PASTA domain-containing protein [bacterium]|nr:PASTA domain-containing protein [bacterium]